MIGEPAPSERNVSASQRGRGRERREESRVEVDPETLDIVSTAAKQKQVEVLMKIYWGDPREKLCEAIDKIPLSCLIVGNRGLSKLKRVLLGSVSNYLVNNGSCPVTVVKTP
ncbi:universal stress protein YxiE-like [Hibiscus syriacus]|nr:universal stress protein YxiE-like [Hibiscus syriacus]